jgi:hypothetical protein
MGFWSFVQPRVNTAVRELTGGVSCGGGVQTGGVTHERTVGIVYGAGGGDDCSRRSREVRYVGWVIAHFDM